MSVVLSLVGCQREDSLPAPSAEDGSARFAISVQQAVTAEDVQRVEVILDAADIPATTVQLVEDTTVWTGLMSVIRAGSERRFRASAYDAQDKLIFRGEATGVTITANQTVQVNILLQQVDPSPEFSNAGPIITSLVVSRSSVEVGGFVDLLATARDPNPGDVLSYAWTATAGTFDNAASRRARWTAPATEGIVTLTLTVSDQLGASTSVSFVIQVDGTGVGTAEVIVRFNAWPEVVSLTGAPTQVVPGQAIVVSAQGTDNDDSATSLAYSWSASCEGTWTDAGSRNARFTPTSVPANATCDNCQLTVRVSDGRGGEGFGRLGVCVGPPVAPNVAPRITSAFQTSRNASAGSVLRFSVRAVDPEGSALTFAWETNTGALGAPTSGGDASEVLWTAPACVDAQVAPVVTVRVADAEGLETLQSFPLTWRGLACPTAMVFRTQPTDVLATAPISPDIQVELLDSLGRNVPVSSGVVTLSIGDNPGGGVLSGTASATLVAGVATFTGLSIDASDVGYTLVASSAGLPSVSSVAFTVHPLVIQGSRLDDHLTTGNVLVQRSLDLSATTISALVERQDGGFATYPGTGTAAGTFSISGVPRGAYYLRIGSDYIVTSSRSLDLGTSVQGRPDAVVPANTTYLAVDLQGLATWQAEDYLEVFSASVGLWGQGVQLLHQAGTAPTAGAVRWTQTLRYRGIPGSRLLESARGDSLTFHQLSTKTPGGTEAGETLTYSAATRAFTTTATVANATTTSVAGTMAALPQDQGLLVDWRATTFEGLRTAVHPAAQVDSHALYVSAFPDGTRGTYAAAPDLMTFYPPVGGGDRALSFSYGNPFPGFAQAGQVSTEFTVAFALPLPGGGTAEPMYFRPSVTYADALPAFGSAPLTPRLSPVRTPTLNGQDAFGTLSGVGLTPRLAWSAPSVGDATHYRVRIFEIYVDSEGSTVQGPQAGRLYTSATQLTVPPGVLEAGKRYFALVEARSSGNLDFQNRPFRSAWPEASAMLVTGVFAP
ncbi:hypothetical protein [Myxococcus sp. CA039A]|uniref:hypothetical protein n=1 Tax=Myxococcus sp. CA039A TaxID=2741737 RepID=UPI00157B6362|nr:hypothetical protein [Myxococcus sp. CA039A]NTX53367.1 hypothetical protein [Myxococcus sp. CA039A]